MCSIFCHSLHAYKVFLVLYSVQFNICKISSTTQCMYKHVSPQGEAETYFLGMFNIVLNDILCNNPTWSNPKSTRYFLKILQCPQCESGVWPFLQTSVRYRIQQNLTSDTLALPSGWMLGNSGAALLITF